LKTLPNYLSFHDNDNETEVYHSNTSQGSSNFSDYGHVIYKEVTFDIISSQNQGEPFQNGKVKNEYKYLEGAYNIYHPYPSGVNKDWTSGYLSKQKIYDSSDNLLIEKEFIYDEFTTGIEIRGYKPSLPSLFNHGDDLNKYTIYANYFLPISYSIKEHISADVINETVSNIEYNESMFATNDRNDRPIGIVTTFGDLRQIRKEFKYSSDYDLLACVNSQQWQIYSCDEMIKSLRNMHRWGLKNIPIEVNTYSRDNSLDDWCSWMQN
jgi:hypothetical protein